VCKAVAPEQITRKPAGRKGVILFQIENEYDYAGGSEEARTGQLNALYDEARGDGIDIPILTCWTHEIRQKSMPALRGTFDASNLYSGHDIAGAGGAVDALKKEQPDAPGMIAELQGGWFSQVGGRLSEDQPGIGPDQIRAITLECVARGATILSHYMLFGGTHFDDWGARGLTTTYDYNAPIREWGALQDKYREVWAVAHMLYKYGERLAVSDRVDQKVEENEPDTHFIVRRSPDGEHFVFMRNSSETESRVGMARVTVEDGRVLRVAYDLPPFGTDVVAMSPDATDSWKGLRICVPPAPPTRPEAPGSVRIASVSTRPDGAETAWRKRAPGESLEAALGRVTGLSLYREKVRLTREQIDRIEALSVKLLTPNECSLAVNGVKVPPAEGDGRRVEFDVKSALRVGDNEFVLLHEDAGRPNGGGGMEDLGGVEQAFLRPVLSGIPVTDWRVKTASRREAPGLAREGVDDTSWERVVLDDETVAALKAGGQDLKWPAAEILNGKLAGAVYRAAVEVTAEQIAAGMTTLIFDRIDDRGTIYVNGKLAGRHDQWDVPCELDVQRFLRPGRNLVAVYVVNTEGEGGLTRAVRLVEADVGIAVPFSQIGPLRGYEDRWWRPDLSSSGWRTEALDVSSEIARKGGVPPKGPDHDLATWYRAEFELPAIEPGVWIPWRVLVRASGNGEMFLNGHSIGRYWEVGPQREFFLPDCWLSFGKGKRNTLALCLRSTVSGAKVEALEVSPYPDSAEFRK